jgi:hypothetical protein
MPFLEPEGNPRFQLPFKLHETVAHVHGDNKPYFHGKHKYKGKEKQIEKGAEGPLLFSE